MIEMILHPDEIERESMRIIQEAIGTYSGPPENLPVIKRVIHASADFDFLHTLTFSHNVVHLAHEALRNGTNIIADTLMLSSGISKPITSRYGINIICSSSDEAIKAEAKSRNITRAMVNIEHAVKLYPNAIYAIGNAPTALIRLCELIHEGQAKPALVIGVPVGFVNVIEAKEMLSQIENVPRIIAMGNKGGSTVACAIVNALLYGL